MKHYFKELFLLQYLLNRIMSISNTKCYILNQYFPYTYYYHVKRIYKCYFIESKLFQ